MFKHYVYKKPSVRFAMRLYDASGSLLRKKRKPRLVTEPRRICVVVLHQIGDVVMSLPTIEMIATMFPQAKLSIISGQGPAPLFENNPWGAKVYPFDALWQKVVRQLGGKQKAQAAIKESKQAFLALIKEINPDAVVVFHPDLIVNQLLGKTVVPHTFSFTNAGGGFRVTHPLPMPQRGHQVERNHSLAKALATTFHKKTARSARTEVNCIETRTRSTACSPASSQNRLRTQDTRGAASLCQCPNQKLAA